MKANRDEQQRVENLYSAFSIGSNHTQCLTALQFGSRSCNNFGANAIKRDYCHREDSITITFQPCSGNDKVTPCRGRPDTVRDMTLRRSAMLSGASFYAEPCMSAWQSGSTRGMLPATRGAGVTLVWCDRVYVCQWHVLVCSILDCWSLLSAACWETKQETVAGIQPRCYEGVGQLLSCILLWDTVWCPRCSLVWQAMSDRGRECVRPCWASDPWWHRGFLLWGGSSNMWCTDSQVIDYHSIA